MACEHLDDDILGINLIHDLGMSYDAKAQEIFTISDDQDQLVATGETTISPFSMTTITAKYTGHAATFMSTRLRHLQGGPALVKFNDHRVCYLAITNTAPYSVTIGRNEVIGGLDDPRPLDQDIVTKFISKLETKAQKLMLNPSGSTKLLSDQKIQDKANLNVPDQFNKQ